MGKIASQIIRLTIVYSTVYSDADERKHQSSALLAFVRGIHRSPFMDANVHHWASKSWIQFSHISGMHIKMVAM